MIKQIYLKNFQSHKETTINLVDGINIVIGLGNSGKTAIIRALNLLVNNRPLGFRYHSNFSKDKETVIRLVLENDSIIELVKTKSSTIYKLNNEEYSCVGSSVPDVIKNAINIDDINVAFQLDTPFLICNSPGEVAKTFNQITNIEEADTWIAKISSKINGESKEIKLLDEQLSILDERIKKYNYVKEAEKEIQQLDLLGNELKLLEDKIDKLAKLIGKHNSIKPQLDYLIKQVEGAEIIKNEIGSFLDRLDLVCDEVTLLEEYIDKKKELEKYDYVNNCNSIIEDIEIELEEFKNLEDRITKIENTLDQVDIKRIEITALENQIHLFSEEYIDILKSEKKCPTCNNEITENMILEIQKELK